MTDAATSQLTYADRIELLRQRKLRQTAQKIAAYGPMDEDDYSTVVPPEGLQWRPIPNHPNGSFYGARGWGDNFRSLMEVCPVYVDPADAIAGRVVFFLSRLRGKLGQPNWLAECDWPHLRPEQDLYNINPGIGSDTHFGGDYRIGLKLGWGGLLEKVREYRQVHNSKKGRSAANAHGKLSVGFMTWDTDEFYQAEEDVILGVQCWIQRHVDAIHSALQTEPRPELKENLRELAEVNQWVLRNPPRTFHEACQWIAWFNLASRTFNRDGAGHQLDEILRPYYEADVAAGRLDDEKAIFILACLLLSETRYYQIAGPGPDGRDQTSRLSFLILEAAHRLGVTVNLTIRVHDGLDEELFLKSVRHLFEDRKGWPRYSGDKALTEGFMRNGYPAELARQRIAVGCHWMAIPGREYTMNDTVKINVAKVFEVAFWEMISGCADAPRCATGGQKSDEAEPLQRTGPVALVEPKSPTPSVADLWRRFEHHLRKAVVCTREGIDWHLDHQKYNQPELLLNLLCYGPIEKGRDVTDGAVEFYNMCIDGSGLATVADSLAALDQRIEREGAATWQEVADHLRGNYAGVQGERVRLMMKTSQRYGRGGGLGDEWAVRVSRLFTDLVKELPTPGGRNVIPGWFTWSSTIALGKGVGATPNGRRAGEPISHGANPDPGFRKDGAPTAMSQAVASIQPGYGNTAPIQLELDPGLSREEGGVQKIAALIRTHFEEGGTLFNINVIDAEKLRQAHQDPSRYPDLIVRVTGFTAYFAALSPAFRQLVIDRIVGPR